jgi:hypothetical protein
MRQDAREHNPAADLTRLWAIRDYLRGIKKRLYDTNIGRGLLLVAQDLVSLDTRARDCGWDNREVTVEVTTLLPDSAPAFGYYVVHAPLFAFDYLQNPGDAAEAEQYFVKYFVPLNEPTQTTNTVAGKVAAGREVFWTSKTYSDREKGQPFEPRRTERIGFQCEAKDAFKLTVARTNTIEVSSLSMVGEQP